MERVISLCTAQSPPSLTAFRYLASLSICEPEMWILLTNKKLSWCDSTRVSYRVPDDSHAATNKEVVHYYARPRHHDNLSVLVYLRLYNTSVTPPKLYKDNASILVGLQYLSIYNTKYFFQYLLVYYPHRRVDDILPTTKDIPPQLVHFAVAHRLMLEHFTSTDHFADELHNSGNTQAFTRTACHYLESLQDLLYLQQQAALPVISSDVSLTISQSRAPLSTTQVQPFMCFKRRFFCSCIPLCTLDEVYYSNRKARIRKMLTIQMLTIHPLTEKTDDRSYRTFHPCIPAYTCTIAKMQGQTLENIILWFDTCTLPCGTAYVALSRARTLENIKFLTPITLEHFLPMAL